MKSAIYCGYVRHRRFEPKVHRFQYPMFMLMFDLSESDEVLGLHPLWSDKWWAPFRFSRKDFHGDANQPLIEAVKNSVEAQTGLRPEGRVQLLANWRYFGKLMNPLSVYYCYNKAGTALEAIIAEVTNTPWNERHAYVLSCNGGGVLNEHLPKKMFPVSPFHPLDMDYKICHDTPKDSLFIHIQNLIENKTVFDADLNLLRIDFNKSNLNKMALRYPFFSVKILCSIYWEALMLFLKGVPFLGKGKGENGG